jgi:hypothetical protein
MDYRPDEKMDGSRRDCLLFNPSTGRKPGIHSFSLKRKSRRREQRGGIGFSGLPVLNRTMLTTLLALIIQYNGLVLGSGGGPPRGAIQ